MHSDKLLSDTIRFLRFPLMVGVVIVHTTLDSVIIGGDSVTQGGMFPIFDIFNHLFDGEIVRMRVPLFFFFSGFLFFFQGAFSKQLYADKLKRRVKTLLVPYLFWISALLLMIFVAWQISGALMESVHDLLFFDNMKKSQQTKFYGVFRTSANLPNIFAPILGAAVITVFGATHAVWALTAVCGVLSVIVLTARK